MADPSDRLPENVAGKYYVDNQCIDCDLCRETAPANFTRNDDGGHSYVYKQPENADEEMAPSAFGSGTKAAKTCSLSALTAAEVLT